MVHSAQCTGLQTCSCWKVMSLVRQTSSTVMLSQPRPPIPQSGARHSCISFSHTSLGSHPSFSASRQKSTTSYNHIHTDHFNYLNIIIHIGSLSSYITL